MKVEKYSVLTSHCLRERGERTYTAAGRDRDLDGVAASLTNLLQVERFVASLPLRGSLYRQRLGVDADLDAAGPVGVHGSVLVVETFQLQLQVRSPHQSLVNLPGLEDVRSLRHCLINHHTVLPEV